MTGDKCFKINLADALTRLPGPQQENVVTVLEHGSLVTKLYTPGWRDSRSADDLVSLELRATAPICALTEVICAALALSLQLSLVAITAEP